MLTTGIHVPRAVLKKLAKSVAAIQRETASMTLAEWRKSYRAGSGPMLGCYISVELTKSGAVKGFHARTIDRSTEKIRAHGFEADVPVLGNPEYAAKALAGPYAEFLLEREVEMREMKGLRELVALSDDELAAAAEELKPM